MKGLQKGSKGVRINEEGEFLDIGTVFCSKDATANITGGLLRITGGRRGGVPSVEKPAFCRTPPPPPCIIEF